MSATDWIAKLRSFVAARHLARPVPDARALTGIEHHEYMVHGGFMQSWLREHGPRMLSERAAILEVQGRVSRDPIIVAHGDLTFAAAMRALVGEAGLRGEGRVVVLLDDEYATFLAANPEAAVDEDREFDFHVSTWARFEPASPALLDRARALGRSIDTSGTYVNHINGTLWAPRCGLEVENLWSWNGTALDLVEEAITHVRY